MKTNETAPASGSRAIKKIELHRHLEGSVKLQTVLDVAGEASVTLPARSLEELRPFALITEPMKDLGTVLNKFMLVQSCLATPKILERVAYENCIDAFDDGIRVLELRYSPGFIQLGHPQLNYDVIHRSITDGIARARKELARNHGEGCLAVGLICIISRDQPMIEAEKTADFVLANRDAFVGFDLAGDEKTIPAGPFKKYFSKAAAAGLGITVHSGEIPGSAGAVKVSVEELGATRIGHGIQIIHDEKIMDFVISRDVTLEVCPSSNVLTRGVESLASHPLPAFLKRGVPVTLNSDDPHIFGIDLTHEYDVCENVLKLKKADFDKMNARALKTTFIDSRTAAKAWNSSP